MKEERSASNRLDRAQLSDDELIAGYLAGTAEAYAELESWIQSALRRHYPGLSREHEDLAQSAHGKLLVSLTEGRFTRGSALRAYVIGVVHHAAIDRLREIYKLRVTTEALLAEPTTTWHNPYSDEGPVDETQLLHQALLATPARCRELWRLLLVERQSYEEIGRSLALPHGTVKSRMWHCRRKALAALRRLRLMNELAVERGRRSL